MHRKLRQLERVARLKNKTWRLWHLTRTSQMTQKRAVGSDPLEVGATQEIKDDAKDDDNNGDDGDDGDEYER